MPILKVENDKVEKMAELFCVRENFGQYADNFVKGGYAAIGWFEKESLSKIKDRQELEELYKKH